MADIVRRHFIQTAAAASAAIAAAPAFGAAPGAASKLSDIDHIIILMKENRSFDHYFGMLRGVRGFGDPTARQPNGQSLFRQKDALHPDGEVLPFRVNTLSTSGQHYQDLSHAWGPQHVAWNAGGMDMWLPAHRAADGDFGPLTMGYMTRQDLPYYYALAEAFTICDGYHCSMFGPTHPNRYHLMTATNDPEGRHGGPALDNKGKAYTWETYPERLQRAGISWRVYHDTDDYGCNVLKYFTQFQGLPKTSPLYDNAIRDRPFETLLADLRRGDIPQVSWIVPPATVSEHPSYLPAAGEHHTAQILEALWSNPKLWARTALILNYDENDGQFDHVAPPTPPRGTPNEFIHGLPVGLGFRVPCLVISPFSRGGYVCGATFDHTSTLKLLEARFGVEVANLSDWRRRTAGDMTSAFGFGAPPDPEIPRLPQTGPALQAALELVKTLPSPTVPLVQTLPMQEPGSRPRRV
ncbi:MAG TPA: alkaline phosphatase family protein [Phenylobacterium sp.]|jgi:phospholipase C|uniref:alkaline phosphatase family protein n=1 Tax=Phenylobacterium sp. TaxID=1871053 RepID=UPI002D282959|nr:alkaline phosphatase family protein [Phenylobacterium sp.]HZZ70191.1 alkaline phosphatase family protein [Phenylobacterium sp.]